MPPLVLSGNVITNTIRAREVVFSHGTDLKCQDPTQPLLIAAERIEWNGTVSISCNGVAALDNTNAGLSWHESEQRWSATVEEFKVNGDHDRALKEFEDANIFVGGTGPHGADGGDGGQIIIFAITEEFRPGARVGVSSVGGKAGAGGPGGAGTCKSFAPSLDDRKNGTRLRVICGRRGPSGAPGRDGTDGTVQWAASHTIGSAVRQLNTAPIITATIVPWAEVLDPKASNRARSNAVQTKLLNAPPRDHSDTPYGISFVFPNNAATPHATATSPTTPAPAGVHPPPQYGSATDYELHLAQDWAQRQADAMAASPNTTQNNHGPLQYNIKNLGKISQDEKARQFEFYLANTAAIALQRDIVVTSMYRPGSKAHNRGAIDITAPADAADRVAEAKLLTEALGPGYRVIIEELDPRTRLQTNIYFEKFKGKATLKFHTLGPLPVGSHADLHASGTHIHIQPNAGTEPPASGSLAGVVRDASSGLKSIKDRVRPPQAPKPQNPNGAPASADDSRSKSGDRSSDRSGREGPHQHEVEMSQNAADKVVSDKPQRDPTREQPQRDSTPHDTDSNRSSQDHTVIQGPGILP